MKLLNNYLRVTFDPLPLVGGLMMPERYLIQAAEKDGEHDAYGVTTDRRLINPQTCTEAETGRRLFVHFGAYEWRKEIGDGTCFIPGHMLLFELDPIRLPEGAYIGEEVFTPDEVTDWGFILKGGEKEGLKVRLVYGGSGVVLTCDPHQYVFRMDDKKYIYITDKHIVGHVCD